MSRDYLLAGILAGLLGGILAALFLTVTFLLLRYFGVISECVFWFGLSGCGWSL
jgi:hypothetical protein